MSKKINIPKGTKDLFFPEIEKWQYVEDHIRNFFARLLYKEIRTPIFEHNELFQRGIGGETEVVQKEMYTFLDKAGRQLTLRPENTASVVRSAIENNLINEMFPLRFFYIGPMFRYEKPQKGRYRQFHQMGIEVFGDDSPGLDAEVIYSAFQFLEQLNMKQLKLEINSVGCRRDDCRTGYIKTLSKEAEKHKIELCQDCQRKTHTNPLRIFDCKKEQCNEISKNFPVIIDHLCQECHQHFKQVKTCLSAFETSFNINPRMVRGLDYYTKTAFEITSSQLGSQDAVLGGGRYNDLIKELGGPDLPGIGFAAGLERIILHIEASKKRQEKTMLVAYQNEKLETHAINLIKNLWEKGFNAYISYNTKNMKKQFKKGDRIGATHALILGEEEVKNQSVSIKNMNTKEQMTIKLEELDQWLKKNL